MGGSFLLIRKHKEKVIHKNRINASQVKHLLWCHVSPKTASLLLQLHNIVKSTHMELCVLLKLTMICSLLTSVSCSSVVCWICLNFQTFPHWGWNVQEKFKLPWILSKRILSHLAFGDGGSWWTRRKNGTKLCNFSQLCCLEVESFCQ